MRLGLITGLGLAATDFYYRGIVREMSDRSQALEMVLAHADAATLISNYLSGSPVPQSEIFADLTRQLHAAGAELVALSSVAGHFCFNEFRAVSVLPAVDIVAETYKELSRLGLGKVGMLGAGPVMKTRFFGGLKDIEVVLPPPGVLEEVHASYVDLALSGETTDEMSDVFARAGTFMVSQGAEAIVLGGTDLPLALSKDRIGFKTIDCCQLHIRAIADRLCLRGTETS